MAGDTTTLTDLSLTGNTAQGGTGGSAVGKLRGARGGNGLGGGMYVAVGTVTLTTVTVSSNTAQSGTGGSGTPNGAPGSGTGGGIYINSAALVYLDAFTVAHVMGNHASSFGDNICGPYYLGMKAAH